MASNEIACHIPNTSNLRVCPSPTVGGAGIFGVRQGWDILWEKKLVLLSGGWPTTFMSVKSIPVYFNPFLLIRQYMNMRMSNYD